MQDDDGPGQDEAEWAELQGWIPLMETAALLEFVDQPSGDEKILREYNNLNYRGFENE